MAKSRWFIDAPPVPPSAPISIQKPATPLLRRWTMPVLAATAIIVIGLLVLEIALLKSGGRKNDEPPPAPKADTDKPATPREDTTAKVRKEEPVRAETVHFDPPPTPRPQSAEKKSVKLTQPVLTVVGGLTAAHVYQSYLNIGLIADGVANDVYKIEDGKELLDGVGKVMDNVERQLAQLSDEDLRPAEKKQLEKVRSLLSLLRTEIRELKSFWDTGDDDFVRRFKKIHKEVWAELSRSVSG